MDYIGMDLGKRQSQIAILTEDGPPGEERPRASPPQRTSAQHRRKVLKSSRTVA